MIPDDVIEQVREAADLVGIIGEHVELKRTGSDFRGPCPFHGGTHRNFAVIPKKGDRKSTRLNSSHGYISYAVFCLKKKKNKHHTTQHARNRLPNASTRDFLHLRHTTA